MCNNDIFTNPIYDISNQDTSPLNTLNTILNRILGFDFWTIYKIFKFNNNSIELKSSKNIN